jgi:dsRNA-specific ribonuclease
MSQGSAMSFTLLKTGSCAIASKKEAEQRAAFAALSKLDVHP